MVGYIASDVISVIALISINSNFTEVNTFTINGTASQYVVFNIPDTGGHGFNGSIVLTGGITADHVLFNFDAGNYTTLSGGQTLTISTNGNTITGIFLDPNGNISIDNSVIDGRVIGGDTQDFQFVSGAELFAPPSTVPLPSAGLLFGSGLLSLVGLGWRRKK